MGGVQEFLADLKKHGHAAGNFLGLLNVLIGRRIQKQGEEAPLSTGLTWREASVLLKKVRWDKDAVRELGLDPAALPPRDRQRYWYTAVAQARVDSPQATEAGDRLAKTLGATGYLIGAAPSHEGRTSG